jgi:hypothetical protein
MDAVNKPPPRNRKDRISLPRFPGRGRPSAAARAQYDRDLEAFCKAILKINSTLDFKVSARGWCYILEEKAALPKGDFDKAEAVINDARKSGLLPINICAEDKTRQSTEPKNIDDETVDEFAEGWISYLQSAHESYTPISFWGNQPSYVEQLVEKINLKSLFQPDCDEFRVRIGNTKGWLDINQRAQLMRRFQYWEPKVSGASCSIAATMIQPDSISAIASCGYSRLCLTPSGGIRAACSSCALASMPISSMPIA